MPPSCGCSIGGGSRPAGATSENNRKAKFYAITAAGRRQLAREVETWDRLASLIARLRGAEQA